MLIKVPIVDKKERTAFEYMCGMASAGFELAEEQGRTLQSNTTTRTEFIDWKKQKEAELQNAKASTHQTTKTNSYQTTAQF